MEISLEADLFWFHYNSRLSVTSESFVKLWWWLVVAFSFSESVLVLVKTVFYRQRWQYFVVVFVIVESDDLAGEEVKVNPSDVNLSNGEINIKLDKHLNGTTKHCDSDSSAPLPPVVCNGTATNESLNNDNNNADGGGAIDTGEGDSGKLTPTNAELSANADTVTTTPSAGGMECTDGHNFDIHSQTSSQGECCYPAPNCLVPAVLFYRSCYTDIRNFTSLML